MAKISPPRNVPRGFTGVVAEIYRGRNWKFYWRLWSRNRRVIADGAEGYDNRSNAQRAARRVYELIRTGPITVVNNFTMPRRSA